MQFHQLKRNTPNMKRMTVARGGKRGKTAGRGGKGQSARAGNKRRPEWRDIIKRIPKLRGRGKNSNKTIELSAAKAMPVNLVVLESIFSAGDSVTPTILVEKRIVSTWSGNIPAVKILGGGEITKALKISGCAISESAKAKIEKAGGTITALASRVISKNRGPSLPSDVNTAPVKVEKREVKKEKIKKGDKVQASIKRVKETKTVKSKGNKSPGKPEKA